MSDDFNLRKAFFSLAVNSSGRSLLTMIGSLYISGVFAMTFSWFLSSSFFRSWKALSYTAPASNFLYKTL
ncbi:MAG: hypothetical protein ACD_47C00232G0001 [uncultured bacterium]|nr:MAG: hypothetical protein ACD_47C00232G0001 [uncultured bacterium]